MVTADTQRVPTGIFGLDDLIGGGFIPRSTILLCGKTGTCKTIFSAQYAYYGAAQYQEPTVYITTEENANDIKADVMQSFGWDLDTLEKQGLLMMIEVSPEQGLSGVLSEAAQMIVMLHAKRVVLDSISVFEIFMEDIFKVRYEFMNFLRLMKSKGVTTVITAEILETSEGLSRSDVVEFVVDAVIKLDYIPMAEEHERTLTIRKMRRSKHSKFIHPFDITQAGIQVKVIE